MSGEQMHRELAAVYLRHGKAREFMAHSQLAEKFANADTTDARPGESPPRDG